VKRELGLFSIVLVSVMTLASWNLVAEEDRSEVLDRIKPIGTVAITGQPAPAEEKAAAPAAAPAPAPAVPAVAATTQPVAASGVDAVYQKSCFACHATGAAGAPKLGDKAAWGPRIEKGIDALMTSAINGTPKGMPPKGTCMACTDAELKSAVEYMVSQAK